MGPSLTSSHSEASPIIPTVQPKSGDCKVQALSRQSPDPARNHRWCLLNLFFLLAPSSNTVPSPWSPGENASVGRVLLFQGQLQPFFTTPDLRNLMKLLLCAHTLLDSEGSRTKPKMPGPGGRLRVRLSQG